MRGLLFLVGILGVLSLAPQPVAAQDKYLIASIPVLKQIHYAKLPDTVMRPLIVSGLIVPKAIAVDAANNRLFVSDKAQFKIFWYQLIATADGKLITDGTQHVAMDLVLANEMTVDAAGNLFYTGKAVPPPGFSSEESVYMHGSIALATGSVVNPVMLWDPANTGPAPTKVKTPSAIATNGFEVYWGNSEGAKVHGSISRAPASPQSVAPNLQVKKMADNADSVRGLVLTPKYVFYSTGDSGQIFGISMSRVGTCGTECKTIVSGGKLTDPRGMVWDGDGTVFVADTGQGKVFSFPSGNLGEHELSEVVAAPLWDLALLQVPVPADSGGFLGSACRLALRLPLLLALLAAGAARVFVA